MSELDNLNETPDYTEVFDQNDVNSNRAMGILAYIGPLVLIPLFAAKESPFARFHSNQGLVLLIAEVIASTGFKILSKLKLIGWIFKLPSALVSIGFSVLVVMGIVNAARGRAKELPVIGSIQIIK